MTDKFIDLHLHLDGAITSEIAKKLAEIQGITLPCDDELKKQLTVPDDCRSLNDFLKCFALPDLLMQTPESLEEAVYLVAEEAKNNGVIYAEIRFAPQLHTARGMTQEDAVKSALRGLQRSTLRSNLILCCMRGEGNDKENEETVNLAKKYLTDKGGVAAVDLAGAEALFTTDKYAGLFSQAGKLGIPFTIHAGEADGSESVRLAAEYGAKRIGHGVRAAESDDVMNLIKENNIVFEMCPTSNRQTHAVEDMDRWPIRKFLDYGIKVTINTDDPAIEGTDIAKEFAYISEKYGITGEEKQMLLLNAADAAFADEETKEYLRSVIKKDNF